MGWGKIVAHAHRALQDSIPVSQTFTARVLLYQYSSGAKYADGSYQDQIVAGSSLVPPIHYNRYLVAKI